MKSTIDILNEQIGQGTNFEIFGGTRRVFELNTAFDFVSGTLKIEGPADVAYVFKKLEDKAVENAFAVLVKDGDPTVLHLATGSATRVTIDYATLVAAVHKINPDQIYFVHNHPSGDLVASNNDITMYRRLQGVFGKKLQPGIIININSGKFGIYDEDGDMGHDLPQKHIAHTEVPLKVYSFSKLVFEKDYNPEKNLKIKSSQCVAQFVSSHRTGDRNKMNLLALRSDNSVIANIFLPYTEITHKNITQIAIDIVLKAMPHGATSVISYGRFSGLDLCNTLRERIKEKSLGKILVASRQKSILTNYSEYRKIK